MDAARHAVPTAALTLLLAAAVTAGVELVHVQTDPWLDPLERVAT
ncbi:MAG: hypothetical protein ACYC1Z_13685 [Georgenia sp.]